MPTGEAERATQLCPACGRAIQLDNAEPLERIICPACGEAFHVRRSFHNFELLETIGVGGMGTVYKARDSRLDRFVALKILRRELSTDPKETTRLEQEARLSASLNHQHVLQVFSSGIDHGQLYLVMELVERGSLDDLMALRTRVPEAQVLKIGMDAARGLEAAHARGLMHRDIKPANILFADDDNAKIGDFGLAVGHSQAADPSGEVWGTPYYVAPERLNSEPEDFRSDIYSLGATLYHALAGVPPIQAETTSASTLRELKMHPRPIRQVAPDVSRRTARIIDRMIAPKAADRFQSYDELIEILERAHGTLLGIRPGVSRTWLLIGAVGSLVVGAAVAAYIYHVRANPDLISLTQLYEDARHELVAGKTEAARAQFTRLSVQAHDRQPILDWILLHRGLASLLRGYTAQARQSFEDVANHPAKGGDPQLQQFFDHTARTLIAATPIRPAAVVQTSASGTQSFALLLFALKDWDDRDFDDGAALLGQFIRTTNSGSSTWINDYKPIAQKYLADYAVFDAWRKQPRTPESTRVALEKLQTRGRLADEMKQGQATPSSSRSAAVSPLPNNSPSAEQSLWNAAVARYRERVRACDFAGAAVAIRSANIRDSGLKQAQQLAIEKAQWLMQWKNQLVADIVAHPVTRNITDVKGNSYTGIASANAERVSMKLPYGLADIRWSELPLPALLDVATALIPANAPDVADREWRCAIFASEAGENEAAQKLAAAATQMKPEYQKRLNAIQPVK